jgi:lipid A 3-O-deacylase
MEVQLINSNSIRLTVLFAILAVIVLSTRVYAEETSPDPGFTHDRLFTESGVMFGYGRGNIADCKHYEPILLIWHLGIDLKKFFPELEEHKGRVSFYIEPQINPVVNPETDIECGVGLGFKYMYPVTDKLSPYIMGGVGPYYISVVTKDQANGFIFADTIGAGFYYFLTNNSAINLGYRFRHMSNADMALPNGGIDTHSGTIGYSVFF